MIFKSTKTTIFPLLKYGYLFLIGFLLSIPIDIFQRGDEQSGFAISLIILLFSFFSIFRVKGVDITLFYSAILLSILSIFYIAFIYNLNPIKSLLSLTYFFLPITSYFFSQKLIKSSNNFLFLLKIVSFFAVLLSYSLLYTIFISGSGFVRIDGILQGTFFGLNLTGAYGVHSLATHYLLLIFILVFYLNFDKKIHFFIKIIYTITIFIYIYIILLSLSRELLLALVLFFLFYSIYKINFFRTLLLLIGISTFVYLFFSSFLNDILFIWDTKLSDSLNALDLNDLSSGRIELQLIALEQVYTNPFFGTGFNGYNLNYKYTKDLSGWSTHIYYLTSIWKMGLIAFIFYALFWINIFKKMFSKDKEINQHNLFILFLIIIILLFLNLFWDAFLVPNIMIFFSFLCGSIISINSNKKNYNNLLT
jgi:O-antigen ligase